MSAAAWMLVLVTTTTAAAPLPSVEEQLQQAVQLSARRESAAAADLYRQLLRAGHDGADLRYNLGTLLLEQGEVGEAVLQLRAARRRDPLNADVRHNLATALGSRVERFGDASSGGDVVAALGERIPPGAARVALALALSLSGLLLLARTLVKSPAARRVLGPLWALTAVAVVVTGAALALRLSFEAVPEVVVMAPEVKALKNPDAQAEEAFIAHAGLLGVVVDEDGAYARVRLENGLDAWLPAEALQAVP